MNKKEVFHLIIMIEDAYNHPFTRNVGFINANETKEEKIINVVNMWHGALKDQDHETVMKKFNHHIKTNRFPPVIADLYTTEERSKVNHEHLEYMRKLRSGQHGK
ncbi:replicative helicase loader/inhibitor [Metabacillus idriensis]|uniref:replicative helicase loader/inhibitor n=1 Tax=Metabacillus idriensis TaxID=324768 RepID=UPI001CD5530A|nr:replicative helicase loader/inhibitor [Metabacillus idriensis]MCM3598982.1 replicative helicase loader/inhibitor [Metabacillus idriensis]